MDFILGTQNWGRTELLYFLQQTRIVEIALVAGFLVVCIEIHWISDLIKSCLQKFFTKSIAMYSI
jgi:uncharacterized metal-binding protein